MNEGKFGGAFGNKDLIQKIEEGKGDSKQDKGNKEDIVLADGNQGWRPEAEASQEDKASC